MGQSMGLVEVEAKLVRGDQESIQLSGAYATRQTSWRREGRMGHNGQINTGGTWEKGPPVFNDTTLDGASRDSVAAGEGASTGAIAFHPSRYHVYGTCKLPQALPEASSGASPSHIERTKVRI